MIVVMAIIGLIAAIAFPSFSSGLESIRLVSATDSIAAFLNGGLDRAERHQHPVEITISPADQSLTMRSTEAAFVRTITLPQGITITRVLPPAPFNNVEDTARRFYLYPAGAVPAIGVEVADQRGRRRIVRVEPTTGVAITEDPSLAAPEQNP